MEPKRRIIPVFVPHVGCPNDCVFCNQRKISGTLVPATAESVMHTVTAVLKTIEEGTVSELAFYGGSFTALPQDEQTELLDAVSPFLKSGRIDKIRVSTRPDCISIDKVMLLRKYGVRTIELGVQSMDDEVLHLSGRGHTAADTVKASAIIKSCGMSLILQMMTGLPGDTPEKSIETARRITALKPDGVRIYPTVIIRDTRLLEMWKHGKYKEHTVGQAVELCSEIAQIFMESDIPIIRLGLNPTDGLSKGEAVAGAYHPALGELVYSRIYYNKALRLLEEMENLKDADIVLGVAIGKTSLMVGQKRSNIVALKERFALGSVKVRETDICSGEVVIL